MDRTIAGSVDGPTDEDDGDRIAPIHGRLVGTLQRAHDLLSVQILLGIHLALRIGRYTKDAETIGWAASDAACRWASRCDDNGIRVTVGGLERFVAEYVSEVEAASPVGADLAAVWIAHSEAARRLQKLARLLAQ